MHLKIYQSGRKGVFPKIAIFASFLLIGQLTFAQQPSGAYQGGNYGRPGGKPAGYVANGFGKITGTVLDESNSEPIPYATVSLFTPGSEKPVDGTICDDKGKFTIKNIPAGTYKITISFIGYSTKEINGIKISEKGNQVDEGTIKLGAQTKELDEVVVQGQRDLIEERVDRTIYNAENDQTTKGGDATDVLRRVPMLSVDLSGNVSLRGSQNVKVLIDNKPSAITATNLGDALKQIPADQIKSVEVITSPSAKYDAEGSGGIINIITKKNILQGGSLGINTSAGTRGSNVGLNGAYRKGKLGVTLGGFGRIGYNIKGSFENEQSTEDDGVETLTTQEADTRTNMMFGRYTLGLDYDINKYNWVSASFQYGMFNFKSHQDDLLSQTYQNGSLLSSNTRNVNTDNLSGSVDLSLTYIKSTEKKGQEFSLMALYSRNNRTNDFVNNIEDTEDEFNIDRYKNENKSHNQEITLQADYVTPLGDKQILEFGAKDIMRNVSSDYQYFYATDDNSPFIPVTDATLSNVFNYDQNVTAGYVSYTLNLDKYSFKPGVRYEYTMINANFQDEQDVDIPSYGVWVPSLNVSRKLKNGDMIKAAYNRRIQRPSLEYLNPSLQASNPLNITQGNKDLDPEYTNNYELSYSTFIKNTSLNLSTFMRNTRGSIQPVRTTLGQDTVLTTYQNIGKTDNYGLSLFANINISKKFSLSGGGDMYYAVIDNNVQDPVYRSNNEGWVLSGRLFGNYKFTDTWALQFFGFMRGKQINLQGYQTGFGIYSLSVNKSFNDDKGSIGFGAENFFTPEFKMRNEVNSAFVNQKSVNTIRNMSFKINFSYRIGKMTTNPRQRRRKSIENNDLKEGDNNNTQMGTGTQQ